MQISFILPTRNNREYLEIALDTINKNSNEYHEVIVLDDNGSDDTEKWLQEQDFKNIEVLYKYYKTEKRIGHTILYNEGVKMCKHDVFSIFHADMAMGENYVENLTKHLKEGRVVAATRIEPPLHPEGKEKILMDFGMYPHDFNEIGFDAFVREEQGKMKGETSTGIFAPWVMYKKDFLEIGGHDPLFAPFPYEDSDIFQRMILAGFDVFQSRDAFVYHFTCRGHRWTEEIQKDNDEYKGHSERASRNFLRKWGSWIANDDELRPIIQKKYDIGIVMENASINELMYLEPLCSNFYNDAPQHAIDVYVTREQVNTRFKLSERVQPLDAEKKNGILIHVDGEKFTKEDYDFILNISKIIDDSGEIGSFELGNLLINIKDLTSFENDLVKNQF